MTRTLATLFCALCVSMNVYSFETGKYHGVSANKNQVCDLDLIQNADSVTVNKFECIDNAEQIEIGMDPTVRPFGHFEEYDAEHDLTLIADTSADFMKATIRNADASESFNEEIIRTGTGKIQYRFFTVNSGSAKTWFDVPLTKIK